MGKVFVALIAGTLPIFAAGAANAQVGGAAPARPDVTVRAPERMVCRNVTRTATRMRASRTCRAVSQLNAGDRQNQDERLADAADTLDVFGADDLSTNDHLDPTETDDNGTPRARMHDTPLGPR